MPRFRMTVEYDGSPYFGWQRQTNGPSVQGALEAAVLSLTTEVVSFRGAGRTDSGVHAKGQVVHVDLTRAWEPYKLRNALNAHLAMAGEAVSVLDVEAVTEDFDARFPRCAAIISTVSSAANRGWRWNTSVPGGCRKTSTMRPCMRRPRRWWVGMISPPSAPFTARPTARSERWTD